MSGPVSIAEAERRCLAMASCQGFTFKHNRDPADLFSTKQDVATDKINPDEEFQMYFKMAGANFAANEDWLTWTKKPDVVQKDETSCSQDGDLSCSDEGGPTAVEERGDTSTMEIEGGTYQVDVYRHDPLVVLVHNFTTEEECQSMVQEAVPRLTAARVCTVRG